MQNPYEVPEFQAKKDKMIGPFPMINRFTGNRLEVQAFSQMIQSYEYLNAPNFCTQVGLLCSVLRTEKIRVSFERIGKIFGKSKFSVRDMYNNFIRGPARDGRTCSLNDNEMNQVELYIKSLHLAQPCPSYPSYLDIALYISEKFGKNLLMDTLRKLICEKFRYKFKSCIGVPYESDRLETSITDVEQNLNILYEKINGIPLPFIFNIDEVGEQRYTDACEKYVIVPWSYDKLTVPIPVERDGRRSSVLVCISPNGQTCPPQYAITRTTIDSELFRYIPPDQIQLVHTDSGFINTKSMIYWFEESFFPYLRNLRILYNYQGPAVIILDGYKSHENCLNSLDLESQNLIIHYLEPHSSEQTQPLDISIFGAMKRYNSNYKMKSDLSYITNQILKIQGSLFCVCNPIICHSAFRAIGIIPIRYSENPYVEIAGFDVRFCSKVRGYQISQIEYQIQNNIPLTPNQMFIYDQHKKNKNKNQKNSFRIEIPSFETL